MLPPFDHLPIPRAALLVASSLTRVFHRPECNRVNEIAGDQKQHFGDPAKAIAAGFTPCRSCDPQSLLYPLKRDLLCLKAAVEAASGNDARRALVGNEVTIRFADGDELTLRLVTDDEPRVGSDRASVSSPLGAAILGAIEGEVVSYRSPDGNQEVTILRIV